MSRRKSEPVDAGLVMIANLEQAIIQAHDQGIAHGTRTAAERPGVVTLAANIAERLRAVYLARSEAR